MLLLKKNMIIFNIVYYLPLLLALLIDRTIYILVLSGLIPFSDTRYFNVVTVLGPYSADIVINTEGNCGGISEPNMSTSLLYITYIIIQYTYRSINIVSYIPLGVGESKYSIH